MTTASPYTRPIAWWLVIVAAMVFAMVVLGGATRLTESGLSMVHWKPLTVTPPLNAAQWQTEFEAYQQSPEFKQENSWMQVDDFKKIYWLEFLHRLWGRIIGMAFALPALWFVFKGAVDRPLGWKLGGLFILGGAQGVLGWFMVASGLVDRPSVSQYRLAAHFLTAIVLYAALIWVALDLFRKLRPAEGPAVCDHRFAHTAMALPFASLLVMVAGAFVAGLDAGMIYNTFPLMEGRVVPHGLYDLSPWYLNWFENIKTVQFNHRVLAIALVLFVIALFCWARLLELSARARMLMTATLHMTLIQAALGISTLLLVVPVSLGIAHQAGALILFTLALCLAHTVRVPATAQAATAPYPAE